jgi:PAS domain S-box-containing protein
MNDKESDRSIHPSSAGSVAFLAGGGELGALIRAFDWSGTPLGPPEDWPQSLKTAVRIMLTSRQPIWVGWGEDLTYLYNDPYKSIIGGKHPEALGQPILAVWREISDDIGPMLSTAMNGDEGTYVEEQLLIMERNGYPEETYYTFSYSPIPEDGAGGGRAGGIICANTDDTRRVIGERQIALLRELAAGTANVRTPEEVCERSARALATNPHDVLFAMIYMADPDGKSVSLAGMCGMEAGHPAAPATIAIENSLWPFEEVLRTHEPRLVANFETVFGSALPTGAWRQSPSQVAVLPIAATGETGRPGALIVGLNPFRLFDDNYQGFLSLAAGQISASLGNARAYEEERKRAEALAELDRAKTTFFSNVSHEFRTPLTLMLGPLDEILAKPEDEVLPGNRELLSLAHRNGLRLQRLVNMLLEFSRIEAGRVHASYEPIDLPDFTCELASTFRSACERAGLELKVDCDPLSQPVYVDREMWEKVVLNLISNAFKFTLEGEIEVAVRAVDGNAELTVRDTGAGIPPEEMPKLFERFHRVEGTPGRTQEGSGIGLALVQELVRLHGGEVRAESELGRGTTFFVTLPFGKDHLPADRISTARTNASMPVGAAPFVEEALRWIPDTVAEWQPPETSLFPAAAAGSGIRPRILLADDNSDMRDYIRRLLSQGYEVTAVADGVAALRAARKERPDLVLTDVMMPGLDGFGLLRELRSDPDTLSLPIIMLSARAGEESRVEGMDAGADDYLVKPFSARELLARVGAHLQMARLRREAAEALHASHARFEALVNAAPIGIYFVDADMRLRQVNPKARPVFGDIEGLIGSSFVDVIHILWPQEYANEVVERFGHTLVTGEPYFASERVEERLDRKVREYYEWQIHRISLPDGQYGVVCYFNDVSRHVLARQALAEADRRKDEFLATLAHELRNPLAPIRNMLEVMKRADGNGPLMEQARTTMGRQLSHMVRLIDDLLDVSRISRGKVELKRERVELASVMSLAVEACRPLVDGARHEMKVILPQEPIYLNADPVRLAQVFGNILNNASKYTDPGGKIWLTAERQGSGVVVKVKDTGIGIPSDQLGGIFELFTQVDRTLERSQGGLGIGLTLVKQLVEMHGGTVTAHSDGAGQGSEFVVRLPILIEQPKAEQSTEASTQKSTAGRRILVVDDNEDSAMSLAMLLEISGHEVRTANDGLESIDVAEEFRPDVVLMDIGMPKLNGYDAASRIRAQPWGERMILVAVTGWGQEEDRRRTAEAGFDSHLVKPVDYAAFVRLLASLPAGERQEPGGR